MAQIRRALISVSDKTDLAPFAKTLNDAGIEVLSTGGTARVLRDAGCRVVDLSQYTGFPEILDGRVKTLHPKVHAGLLFRRDLEHHQKTVKDLGIHPIDLVVVNLYPFEKTIAKPGVTLEDGIENIDIGGPSMLRSAAKNYQSVTVIVDPGDYPEVARQIRDRGETTQALRRRLAAKVFSRTSRYDRAIGHYLAPQARSASSSTAADAVPPPILSIQSRLAQPLRYGENPHQEAALYGQFHDYFEQLHGKALSYNNILDLTAAAALIAEFDPQSPTLAILKHTNPCGVGQAAHLREAWDKALATDRQAPFGGIIVSNRAMDPETAGAITEIFSEVILAPEFHEEARRRLSKKKHLRLLRWLKPISGASSSVWIRSVGAESFLAQTPDQAVVTRDQLKIVTNRPPTEDELAAMLFGWHVVKHVKSNAIVYAAKDRTLAVGAGQMSRVDSSKIAVWKARQAQLSLQGSAVCSDAFFPFADALIAAADAGATTAIQPGGSVRDAEVIAAANQRGLAMAFTGIRHFRH